MKAKKTVYILLSMLLGLMLSFIAHGGMELLYLKYADGVVWYNHFGVAPCSLPPVVVYGLLLIGLIGGYMLGRMWWRMVYVEKKHWRFRKNKEDKIINPE